MDVPTGSICVTRRNGTFANVTLAAGQKFRVTRRNGTYFDIGANHATKIIYKYCQACGTNARYCTICDWWFCGHNDPFDPNVTPCPNSL